MKFIGALFFFISSFFYAQNLKLDDLIKIRTQEVGFIEEFLTNHNWKLVEIKKIHEYSNELTFNYEVYDNSDAAESFLTILVVENHYDLNFLRIGISSQETMTSYLEDLKLNGGKLITSTIENGEIVKTYKNETTTFKIYTFKAKNIRDEDIWVYEMMISSNRINVE